MPKILREKNGFINEDYSKYEYSEREILNHKLKKKKKKKSPSLYANSWYDKIIIRYRFRKGITYKAYKVFKRFLRRDYL